MYDVSNVVKTYRIARIPKRSGEVRILEIPSDSLKELQNQILNDFIYKMGTHSTAHGFVKNKNPLTNAKVHENATIIIKLDIRDFFKRTRRWTIENSLMKSKKHLDLSEKEIKQILDYTIHKNHLPTGAPTSPALGNICLYQVDKELFSFCRGRGLRYTRYADDMTISSKKRISKEDITTIIKRVQAELKLRQHVLKYNKIKVFSRKNRMEVTGVVINDKPNISKKYRAKVRAAIHQIKTAEDIKKVEGRISWVTQVAPHHGKKLSSQLSAKKQSLGMP